MATVASLAPAHRDMRGEARSYKRDKDHSSKWATGARALPGPKLPFPQEWQYTEGEKVRPGKRDCHTAADSTKTRIDELCYRDLVWAGATSERVRRKNNNARELAKDGTNMSKSLLDLLPAPSAIATPKMQTTAADRGITYSFDAATGPQKKVGLDSLVEKAEQEWITRETDKMVRDEYEILDGSGEKVVLASAKKGKKGSPKHKPVVVVPTAATLAEEDDWEKI